MSNQESHVNQSEQPKTAADYANAGLAPIRLYAVDAEGNCTCAEGAACDKGGKHPVGNGWQRAPIAAAKVDRHIAAGGNVGLRMGEQPGGFALVALDQDTAGAFAAAEANLGPLPATLTARTGGGGEHRVFLWPEGRPLPKNLIKPFPGVDVRSQGGQIVVEPSRSAKGPYTWTDWRAPELLPAAWCDALLAPATRERRERRTAHSEPGDDVRDVALAALLGAYWPPAGIPYGRHDDSRAWGSVLAQRGLSDARIESIVRNACTGRTDQIEHRVTQALEAASQARRFGRDERKPDGTPYEQPIGFDHLSARYGDEYTRAVDALTPTLVDRALAKARKRPPRSSANDEWIEKMLARAARKNGAQP